MRQCSWSDVQLTTTDKVFFFIAIGLALWGAHCWGGPMLGALKAAWKTISPAITGLVKDILFGIKERIQVILNYAWNFAVQIPVYVSNAYMRAPELYRQASGWCSIS